MVLGAALEGILDKILEAVEDGPGQDPGQDPGVGRSSQSQDTAHGDILLGPLAQHKKDLAGSSPSNTGGRPGGATPPWPRTAAATSPSSG